MGIAIDVLKFVSTNLASGVFGYVGGEAVGQVLSLISDNPNSNQSQVEHIGQELNVVQQTLVQIQSELTTVFVVIEKALQEIHKEILYTHWDTGDGQLQGFMSQVATQYQLYLDYAQAPQTTTPGEIEKLVDEITDSNVGANVAIGEMNQLLLPTPAGSKGVLQLWTEMTLPLVESGTMHYLNAVQLYIQYYASAGYAQLKAANLLVEAYNQRGNATQAKKIWTQYQDVMLKQEKEFIKYLVPLIAAGITGGYTELKKYKDVSSSIVLNQAFVDAFPGSTEPNFYQPSPSFEQAEALLSALRGNEKDTGRAVIYMIYSEYYANYIIQATKLPELKNVRISIVNQENSSILDLNTPQSFSFPIKIGGIGSVEVSYYVTRFLFLDIPYGNYKMLDINGGKLPPIVSSMTGYKCYFQNDEYLEYVMQINSLSPASFMDFTAYAGSIPILY